jgi:integrase
MLEPIIKNGVRVLTPSDYEKLISVISKDSLKKMVRVLLLTGMRYQEVLRLKEDPDSFSPERKIIVVKSGKKEASERERYVHLTSEGVRAVHDFLNDTRMTYPGAASMTHNLISWALMSDLEVSPALTDRVYTAGNNEGRDRKNIWGLSVKSFRKSWESWLAVSYPDKLDLISLSQGHLTSTALKHYLAVPFSSEEKDQIRSYTAGWME